MTTDDPAFYCRLGRFVRNRHERGMSISRAVQICRTWRSHLAWHLANALGWRDRRKPISPCPHERSRKRWQWRHPVSKKIGGSWHFPIGGAPDLVAVLDRHTEVA